MELVVGAGNFEGDDEESEGEAEDDVGEAVDAGHGGAAETEAVVGDLVVRCGHRGDSVREMPDGVRLEVAGEVRWRGSCGRGG